jgi:hypothetical protein
METPSTNHDPQLTPGKWYEFFSSSTTLPPELRVPYKVILKGTDPTSSDFNLYHLMSKNMNMIVYRPQVPDLGLKRLPDGVSVRKFNTKKITNIKTIDATALHFLKALVQFRENCLGYDPKTGLLMRSEELKKKLSS